MMLFVDSSGLWVQMGIARAEGGLLGSIHVPLRSELSRDMASMYSLLLERCGLKVLPGYSSILAGRGPGAFIGTRVALSFANGIAAAGRIPVQGFDSLAALRLAADDPAAVAVRDARRGQYYVNDGGESRLLDEAGLEQLVGSASHIVSDSVPAELHSDRSLQKLQDILAHCPGRLSWLEEIPLDAARQAVADGNSEYAEPIYLRGYL